MSLKDRLDAITHFEDQIEEAEALSQDLEQSGDHSLLPAILAMYERNAKQDDFGVFHAFSNWIEELDPDQTIDGLTVVEHLAASVARRPMWKTLELLTMLAPVEIAMKACVQGLSAPECDQEDQEHIAETLRELMESLEDEEGEVDPEVMAAIYTQLDGL